jgi:hypothetical protein
LHELQQLKEKYASDIQRLEDKIKSISVATTTPSVSALIQKYETSTEPPTPPPTPPLPKPVCVFTGCWVEMGHAAIDTAVHLKDKDKGNVKAGNPLSDITKKERKRIWALAVDDNKNNGDTLALWVRLLTFASEGKWTNSTRATYMRDIRTVTTRLHIEAHDDFEIRLGKLEAQVAAESDFKQLSNAELELALMCEDGTLMTTAKLRTAAQHDLDTLTVDSPLQERYRHMLLSFFAYHGQRPGEWDVGYTEEHKVERGYYDPNTATLHLTVTEGKVKARRDIELHPKVAQSIALYHHGQTYTRLAPPASATKNFTSAVTKTFKSQTMKKGNRHGLPYLAPTHLRDLWETHVKYIEKHPKEVYERMMAEIGHSVETSNKKYNQKYRGVVAHPKGYNLNQSAPQ